MGNNGTPLLFGKGVLFYCLKLASYILEVYSEVKDGNTLEIRKDFTNDD